VLDACFVDRAYNVGFGSEFRELFEDVIRISMYPAEHQQVS
jgi:hypothetical protein